MTDRLIPSDLLVTGVAPIVRKVKQVANPAAGTDWALAVPGGNVWAVKAITAVLTTSAAVANRAAKLQVNTGDGIVWSANAAAPQTASLTWRWSWAPGDGYANSAAGVANNAPFPLDLFLMPGYTIQTLTLNMDVADAWSSIRVVVEEGYQGDPWGLAANAEVLDEYAGL